MAGASLQQSIAHLSSFVKSQYHSHTPLGRHQILSLLLHASMTSFPQGFCREIDTHNAINT